LKVLVTGGSGYLGSVLVPELLKSGHDVVVLDNLLYGQTSLLSVASHERFNFVLGDARDERALKPLLADANAIIPLAAVVGAPACDQDPHLAESLNVGAVESILRLRSQDQIIVYPTTNSGYGTSSGTEYCTEETLLEPISLYGRTKVQAEAAVLDGGGSVTFRLATVFGPSPRMRLDLLVNDFVHQALTTGYIVLYESHFMRNYVHIRDVADCFNFALDNFDALKGEAYNFGSDDANMSKQQLAELVKEQVPGFQIFNSEFAEDPDKRNYIVSNAKLSARGMVANRSVSQGISELLKAYLMLPKKGVWRNA